jgi:copper chaperone CopZ
MKFLLIIVLIVLSTISNAQIFKAELQASGLTCSMCNKSIHKSLSTISNVSKIDSDINNNMFTIFFKDSSNVNIDELKTKVEKAGYKVANLWFYTSFEKLAIKNDLHTIINNTTYHFMNVKNQEITGIQKLQIIDKGFVNAKQNKVFEKMTTMKCYKTGVMESCCTPTSEEKKRIFHVTI